MIKYLLLFLFPLTIYSNDLFNQVLIGDTNRITQMINNNIDIKITNNFGMNAFHFVKDKNTAEILLWEGLDINQQNNKGATPLQWAVSSENFDTTAFFLEYGANIDHQDNNGNTALHHAAKGSPEMIVTLIRAGANISLTNNKGYTPLDIARYEGHIGNAPYLSSTAVTAVINENKLIKAPLPVIPPDTSRKILKVNVAPEILAIFSEDYRTAQILIERAADINAVKDEQGNTLLHWAVLKKHRPLIRLLLFKKADPSIANQAGLTVTELLQNLDDKNLQSYVDTLIKAQQQNS